MDIFNNFYKDKKILITGHTGFIGSWLSIWLNELGSEVLGYALAPYTERDNFVVTQLQKRIQNVFGDIRDFRKFNDIFKKFKPEIVFHLAAQPIVRKSYVIPKDTYDINVGGSVNALEAFRTTNSSRVFINMTSDKCYQNKESIEGYTEDCELGGKDPYSSSKACSELVSASYSNSYFHLNEEKALKSISTARCGNIIGGGDWQEDRLIPDCFNAIRNNKEIVIRNPKSIRPWQHVFDPIRGILMLAKQMWVNPKGFSGAWNFGPDKTIVFTVFDIVEKIINYSGQGKIKILNSNKTDTFYETNILVLDCSKSKKYLKWEPLLDIDQTIELVCDWYLNYKVNYDFDVAQIEQYLNLLK